MPTQNQGLTQLPKQKNKQYSAANIQRTAHHVCLSCENKSWNTAIASGWLRTKPTLVVIEFGGLHTVTRAAISPGCHLTEQRGSSEPRCWDWLATPRHASPRCTCSGNKHSFSGHSWEPRTKCTAFPCKCPL